MGRDRAHPSNYFGGHRPPLQLRLRVDLGTGLRELPRLLFQSFFDRCLFCDCMLRSISADIFCDAHATEMWTAHGTEMRGLGAFLRQCFVVELARGLGIEREVEMVLPAELESRPGERIVTVAGAGRPSRPSGWAGPRPSITMIATDGSTILTTNSDFKAHLVCELALPEDDERAGPGDGLGEWRAAKDVMSLDPSHAAPIQ